MDLHEVSSIKERGIDGALFDQLLDVVRSECRDPLEPRDPSKGLVDTLGGDHPSVAHQHDPLDAKASADLLDLRREGGGVSGVSLEDLDGYGAAVGVAQKTVDDLRV